jgi:SAM-dependent methyltransferase
MDAIRGTRITDWNNWHDEYDEPNSELAARMHAVRKFVAQVVESCPSGPVTVLSICAGQGREVIGALADHPRRDDVRGRLLELDPANAEFARRSANAASLHGIEVVTGDASVASAYDDLPPVDLVVISGLFGHIGDEDQQRLIAFLHTICRPGGSVVWTFFLRARRRTERLRSYFTEQSFEEVQFEELPGEEYRFTVALSRYDGTTQPRGPHERVFTFGSSYAR